MKKILLFFFSLLLLNASVNAQSLSGQMYGNNAGNTPMLSFSAAEPFVGSMPASGVGVLAGGQFATLSSSFYTTVADGNWTNPSTWFGGVVPIAGVDITINHNVTVNTPIAEISNSILVNTGASITVSADGVLNIGDVVNNGTMETNGSQGAQLRMYSQTFTNNGTINLNSTGINPNLGGSGGEGGLIGYIFWTPLNPIITNNGVLNINGSSAKFTQQNVVFNNTGAINNNGTFRLDGWDATTTWNNTGAASYSGGGFVEFGATITGNAIYTCNSTFTFLRLYLGESNFDFQAQVNIGNNGEVVWRNGSFVPTSMPFNYGTNVNLFYEHNGVVNKSKEWDETSGLGQPSNIYINSRLNMGYISLATPITANNININPSGSILMDSVGFVRTAPLAISGSLNVNGGRVHLSTAAGGDLSLGGELNVQAASVFTAYDRKLILTGNGDQTIQRVSGSLSFGELVINKTSGGVFLGAPLNLTLDNGNLIDFVSETTLNLNGNNININTVDGFIKIYSNYPTITSTTPAKILFGSGTYNFDMIAGILTVGNQVSIATNSPTGTLNLSTFIDLYGTLEINHPAYTITGEINYQMGSYLLYTFNGSRTTSDEWNTQLNGTSQPKNVSLTGTATIVTLTNNAYRLTQSLFINDGCTLNGTQKLGIRENVTVNPTGSLNLTASGSLEFFASSNCEINIQSTPALPSTCSIEINKSTGTVRLVNNLIGIGGIDFLGSVNFDLNGSNNVTINSAGQIQNEGNGNGRIVNTGNPTLGNGYVQIDVPGGLGVSLTDFGGLGIQLGSSGTTGAVNVKRFPKKQSGFGGNPLGSIERIFAVTLTNAAQITTIYSYFDEELNGIDENVSNIYNYISTTALNAGYSIELTNVHNSGTNEILNSFGSWISGTTYLAANTDGVAPIITIANGNWSDGNIWQGGIPPTIAFGGPKAIIDHNVTLDVPYNISQAISGLQINAGKTLTMSGGNTLFVGDSVRIEGTLNINANSELNLKNSGFIFRRLGTLTASSLSKVSFADDATIYGASTFGILETNANLEFVNSVNVNDSLILNQNGNIIGTVSPTYALNSWLVYKGGTRARGIEWNALVGAGYPQNVRLREAVQFNLSGGAPTINRAIENTLQIEEGSQFTMNESGDEMTSNLTINDLKCYGFFPLSTISGGGLVIKNGDFEVISPGDFYANNSFVRFTGNTATQNLISSYSLIRFTKLENNKTAGNIRMQNTNLDFTGGGTVYSVSGSSGLDLNGRHVTFTSISSGVIFNTIGTSNIFSSTTSSDFNFPDNEVINFTGSFVFGNNIVLHTGANTMGYNGADVTINGELIIESTTPNFTNSPTYGTGSTLTYNVAGANATQEWAPDVLTNPGVPHHVRFLANTDISSVVSFRKAFGNITIQGGATVDYGTSPNEMILEGNFTNNGVYNSPNGTITFAGTANSTLYNPNSFGSLKISKTLSIATVTLNSDIHLDTDLIITLGRLDLNGTNKIFAPPTLISITSTDRLINSSPSLNGYLQVVENNVVTGNYTFGNIGLSLNINTIVGSPDVVVRRIPDLTRLVAPGRNAADNLFSVTTQNGSITAVASINYSTLVLNGSTSGSLKLWESVNGNNLNYTIDAASTDLPSVVTGDASLTINIGDNRFYTVANAAPLAVTKTTNTDGGNWSNAAHWTPPGVPAAGDNIVIDNVGFNVNVDLTVSQTLGTLTVNTGRSMNLLTNNDIYFSGAINNSGTINTANGSTIHTFTPVAFNSPGTYNATSLSNLYMHDGGTINNPLTLSGLTIGGSILAMAQVTIVDSLKFVDLGVWNGVLSPIYNTGSSLVYATNSNINRGSEWNAIGTLGTTPGYPNNVRIYNSTNLDVAGISPLVNRQIAGELRLENGGKANLENLNANFTVSSVYIDEGQLRLSEISGRKLIINNGNLYSDDWEQRFSGNDNSTIEFIGASPTQTLSGYPYFYGTKIIVNKSAGSNLQVAANTTVEGMGRLDFPTTSGIHLGANSKLALLDGVDVKFGLGSRTISGDAGSYIWNWGGVNNYSFSRTGASGDLIIDVDYTINPTINATTVNMNFGTGIIQINKTLTVINFTVGNITNVTGYPVFANNSTLKIVGDFSSISSIWQPGTGNGSLYNLEILDNSTLNLGIGNYYVRGNLTLDNINGNPTLNLSATTKLYVGGNITSSTSTINCNGGSVNLFGGNNHILALGGSDIENLVLNTTGLSSLADNLSITGNLTFTQGNLDLNGNNVLLGNSGNLVNENNNRRIFDSSNTGYVEKTGTFGTSITPSMAGNIGFAATTSGSFGSTNIRRYHRSIAGVGSTASVSVIYRLSTASNIPADVTISYFNNDLNGNLQNTNMKLYRSDNFTNALLYLPVAGTVNVFNAAPAASTSSDNVEFLNSASVMYYTAANTDVAYNGFYSLPSVTFPTFSSAITLLNSSGIAGDVTITLAPGYTEQLIGPIIIDFSQNAPNASNTLTIQGDPNNPATLITPLGGTLDRDAAIYIVGTDFFTMQYFNLIANPAAANNLQRMEWGIGVIKKTSVNGCQNVNLNNWNITLNKLDTVATGIYIGNHGFNPSLPLTITSSGGIHRDINVKRTTISDVNRGIASRGFQSGNILLNDSHFYIGDTLNSLNGNTFNNFGGINYPAVAIDLRHVANVTIANNSINNVSNGGAPALEKITGIELSGNSAGVNQVANNNITLNQALSNEPMIPILNRFNTITNNGRINIKKNVIQNCVKQAGSTGGFMGIANFKPGMFSLSADSNRIINNSINTSGFVSAIFNNSNTRRVTFNADTIRNFQTNSGDTLSAFFNRSKADSIKVRGNVILNLNSSAQNNHIYGYFNDAPNNVFASLSNDGEYNVLAAAASREDISQNKLYSISGTLNTTIDGIYSNGRTSSEKLVKNNTISNLLVQSGEVTAINVSKGLNVELDNNRLNNLASESNIKAIAASDANDLKIRNDSIFDLNQLGNGNNYGIHYQQSTGNQSRIIIDNIIYDIQSGSGTGSNYGIFHTNSGSGSTNMTIGGNKIYGVIESGSGSGAAYGIFHTNSSSSGSRTTAFSNNQISNISGSSSSSPGAYGIFHTNSGSGSTNISSTTGNNIFDISGSGSAPAYGIFHTNSGTTSGFSQNSTTQNNVISDISSSSSAGSYGIFHTNSGTGSTNFTNNSGNNISDINGSGGAPAYGIFHTNSSSGSGYSQTIITSNNNISNVSVSGNVPATGIYFNSNSINGTVVNQRINNSISNINNSGTGPAYGIFHTNSGAGSTNLTVNNSNGIDNISNTGSGTAYGIFHTNSSSSGSNRMRALGNTVRNIASVSDSAVGVRAVNLDSLNFRQNTISKLQTSSGIIEGVLNQSVAGNLGLIANTVMGDFTATNAANSNAVKGIDIAGSGGNLKLYYNTVFIAANSGSPTYGSSVLNLQSNVTVELRNNIFVNKSNATAGGGVRVINRTGAFSPTYANVSGRNIFFVADSTLPGNFIYSDGTNNFQSLSAFKNFSASEQLSYTEDVAFVSIDGLNPQFLNINPAVLTRIESGGTGNSLGVNIDRNALPRFGTAGYIGTGTATDIGAFEGNYLPFESRWSGIVSSNWHNPGNWTANIVPSANRNAVIPSTAAVQPVISAPAVCQHLIFQNPNSTLPNITINAGQNLIINGNVSGNGRVSGAGKCEISGTLPAEIRNTFTASNIDINHANTVTITGQLNVSGQLGLRNGTLVSTGNKVRLTSSGSSAGLINNFTPGYNGNISGTVTVDRFVVASNTFDHFITSPVNNGLTTAQNYQDDFSVTGSPANYVYSSDPTQPQPSPFPTTWWYNETLTASTTPGWTNAINLNMLPGRGVNARIPQNVTFDVTGVPNTGTLPVNLTFTDDGFNLVGNPYPSPISMKALVAGNNSVISPNFYFWNGLNYSAYNTMLNIWLNNTSGTGNDRMSHSQAAFVYCLNAGASQLVFHDSIRRTAAASRFFSQPDFALKLKLTQNSLTDETVITSANGASRKFDVLFDTPKFTKPLYQVPSISIISEDNLLNAIEAVNNINENQEFPVNVITTEKSVVNINLSGLENLPENLNVYFEDKVEQKLYDAKLVNNYSFSLNEGNSGNRFAVKFRVNDETTNTLNTNTGDMYIYNNTLFVKGKTNGNAQVRIFNTLGQLVFTNQIALTQNEITQLSIDNLSGAYLIELQNENTPSTVVKAILR